MNKVAKKKRRSQKNYLKKKNSGAFNKKRKYTARRKEDANKCIKLNSIFKRSRSKSHIKNTLYTAIGKMIPSLYLENIGQITLRCRCEALTI